MAVTTWSQVFTKFLEGTPAEWAGFVVLLVAVFAAGWGLARYRASLRGDSDPAAADAVLMRHLREMRREGAVSEEEFRSVTSRLRPASAGPQVTPVPPLRPVGAAAASVAPVASDPSDPHADAGPTHGGERMDA